MIRDPRYLGIALKALNLYPSLRRTVMDAYLRIGRRGALKAMRREYPSFTVHLTPQGARPLGSITSRGIVIDGEHVKWDELLELAIAQESGGLDRWI